MKIAMQERARGESEYKNNEREWKKKGNNLSLSTHLTFHKRLRMTFESMKVDACKEGSTKEDVSLLFACVS